MSGESESVTAMLADIPANCGVYTAQQVRDYVSGALDDYNVSVVSGALDGLQSGLDYLTENSTLKDDVAALIKEADSGDDPSLGFNLLLGSGVESLDGAKLHCNGGWTSFLLESDFSGYMSSGKDFLQFAGSVAEQIQEYSNGDYEGFISGGYRGAQVYGELGDSVGGVSGKSWSAFISTMRDIVSGLSMSGDGQGMSAFSGLVAGSYVTMSAVQSEMGDRLEDYARKEDLCSLISGCLSGYTASLTALTNAVSGLNNQVSVLQSGIENMVSGLADTIVQSLTTAEEEAKTLEEQQRVAAAKDAFADPVKKAETIDNAKKNIGNSINDNITPAVNDIADALDAPNTDEDVAGAASNVDNGGETAVEAQDTSDNITKPGGVNDGLEGLADMLLGGAT